MKAIMETHFIKLNQKANDRFIITSLEDKALPNGYTYVHLSMVRSGGGTMFSRSL